MKQVILIRKDLKLPKGKIAAIAAHLAVDGVLHSKKEIINKWRKLPHKVILEVENEKELLKLAKQSTKSGLVVVAIAHYESKNMEEGTIKGRTERKEKGLTIIESYGEQALPLSGIIGLSIGPDEEEKIDRITKQLKLYKF